MRPAHRWSRGLSCTYESNQCFLLFCNGRLPGVLEPLFDLPLLTQDCRSPAWKPCVPLSEHWGSSEAALWGALGIAGDVCAQRVRRAAASSVLRPGEPESRVKTSSDITCLLTSKQVERKGTVDSP